MELSIIILNYKQSGLVRQCLKNLQSLKLPLEHEIIVVDNASNDNIESIINNEFLSVKLIKSEINKGFAYGNNLGIKAAQGKYVLILNPDVTILTNAIVQLYEFMESHQQVGLAGPKILNPDGSLQYTCSRYPDWHLPFYRRTIFSNSPAGKKWTANYLMLDYDHSYSRKVDWLFGACLIVRKSALTKVGLLDERYFMYMEDLDWCRRFWQNNFEVWYVVEAEVIHFHQRVSAEANIFLSLFQKPARMHLVSWIKYYWKFRK